MLCLLLLTACVADDGEAESPLFHPITYQVDVSHDEIPEKLVVSQTKAGETIRMGLTLTQEGMFTTWQAMQK